MADWPAVTFGSDLVLSTASIANRPTVPGATSSAAWPAANRAIYSAVVVPRPVTVTHLIIYVGTSSGNVDVGIYNEAGTRLVSSGSTATIGGGAANQAFNIADTSLSPGVYFFAMSCDNTTATFQCEQTAAEWLRVSGRQQEALGSVTLPATATMANPASAYSPHIFAVTRSGVA